MALVAAGGSSRTCYSFLARLREQKKPTFPDTREWSAPAAMPSPSTNSARVTATTHATSAENRTRVKAARDTPSTPPHSDSDPPPASSAPVSCVPPALLTPTTTPIKTRSTRALQNPSIPCPSLQPGHAPQASLPMHLFPPPQTKLNPHSILELTPNLLRRLAYDSSTVHSIPCPLSEFLGWRRRYCSLLDSESDKTLSRLWEYDERNESFIIRCMPTPVHESICQYTSWFIADVVRSCTQLNPARSGIAVHTNTDIKGLGPTKYSQRCPDLCTKVKSSQPKIFIRGIVVEVGFSQSLSSLRKRAIGWFHDLSELHMCILINITEQVREYVDSAGQKISKSKAQKLRNEWPHWLMPDADQNDVTGDNGGVLTLEEEMIRRLGGRMVRTKAEGEQVLIDIKQDLKKWLLTQDEQGVLIPALVEPMDATIYVYARQGNGQVDGDEQAQAAASDAGGGTDAEYPDGDDDSLHHVSLVNNNTSLDNNLDPHTSSNSPSSKTTFSDSETDATCLPISLIFSAPFVASSEPIPPSTHIPTHLAFTIAELYGPLPQPTPSRMYNNSDDSSPPPVSTIPLSILELIPPAVRPHAHNMIAIPFDDLAQLVIDSGEELREDRAVLRAVKIVEREWAKVWEAVSKARDAKQKGERRNERVERVMERRKRKAQDEDGEVGARDTDEEQAETGGVTRVGGRERQKLRNCKDYTAEIGTPV